MSKNYGMVMNQQRTTRENIISYSVGFGLCFYAATLCGAAWVPGCNLLEWYNNFYQFIIIEHHFIVGFTSVTPKVIALFEIIWTLFFLYYTTAIRHPFQGREYGDAKWGDIEKFTKYYADHKKKNEVMVNFGDCKAPEKPVYVNTHNYWIAEGVWVSIDNKRTPNLNFLIVGPPGTGKSFRFARAVLSQLAGNFVVTDPKGELYQQSGQFFEDNGYEVLVLNIESEDSMENSIYFNPFKYLRNESDILSLSQIIFKATSSPDEKGDAFFENSAEVVLNCIFYLMHYTYREEDKDWEHFVELLESTAVKADARTGAIDNSDENGIYRRFEKADMDWRNGVIDGKKHTEHLKGFVDIEKFYTGAQETTSSIIASLDAHCRYMKLQCVKKLLSEDDIDIKNSFGYCKRNKASPTGKRILYIVTSEDKRYFDWITSMVYCLFFDELYHLTAMDASLHGALPEHITFLMDEANNVTLPDAFVDKTSTMRSRNMSVMMIFQNLMQIKNKFPNNDMDKNLIGNMAFTDILGGPDIDSCEYLSKLFGTMTINKKTTGESRGSTPGSSENEDVMQKPLFSPEDMYKMNKDGPCAIAIKGTDPLWAGKCRFEESPLYPLLTRKNPYRVKRKISFEKNVIDYSKPVSEQIPEVLMGTAAKELKRQCEEENIPIIKLTDKELDAIAMLEEHQVKITGSDATTKEFWRVIFSSTARVIEEQKKNALDWDSYSSKQMLVVQKLKNLGFSNKQINGLGSLILADYAYDEIIEFFNTDMTSSEIEDFAGRLIQLKKF